MIDGDNHLKAHRHTPPNVASLETTENNGVRVDVLEERPVRGVAAAGELVEGLRCKILARWVSRRGMSRGRQDLLEVWSAADKAWTTWLGKKTAVSSELASCPYHF